MWWDGFWEMERALDGDLKEEEFPGGHRGYERHIETPEDDSETRYVPDSNDYSADEEDLLEMDPDYRPVDRRRSMFRPPPFTTGELVNVAPVTRRRGFTSEELVNVTPVTRRRDFTSGDITNIVSSVRRPQFSFYSSNIDIDSVEKCKYDRKERKIIKMIEDRESMRRTGGHIFEAGFASITSDTGTVVRSLTSVVTVKGVVRLRNCIISVVADAACCFCVWVWRDGIPGVPPWKWCDSQYVGPTLGSGSLILGGAAVTVGSITRIPLKNVELSSGDFLVFVAAKNHEGAETLYWTFEYDASFG
jgi:hypothetical protein